jgi:hypothetical protein
MALVFVSAGVAAWGDSALCSKNSSLTSFPFTKVGVIAPLSTADEEYCDTTRLVWTGSRVH